MAMKLLTHRSAALALAGGLLFAGSANAQPATPGAAPAPVAPGAMPGAAAPATPPGPAAPGTTSGPAAGVPPTPTMPATPHQTGVLRGHPTGNIHHKTRTGSAKPATVHQSQALRNLRENPSKAPTQ